MVYFCFVCWLKLFCAIANLRIKYVTKTKNVSLLNQAFYMTHPLDSEVSLHYWLLWPIVSRHCPLAPSILPKSIATPTIDAPDEYSFSKNCTNRGPTVFVQATLKHQRSLKRTQKIFQKKSICNGAVIKMEEDQYLTQNGFVAFFSCKMLPLIALNN